MHIHRIVRPSSIKKVIIFTVIFLISTSCFSQVIAITFDDAPSGDGVIFTAEERSRRIVRTLRKHKVQQTAFFVVTSRISDEGVKRLKLYRDAGHLLANHSHSHTWINAIGTANYIRDIQKADSILKGLEIPYQSWYRYPFLDEGSTRPSRDSIRIALKALSLMNAYITIDNYDWFIDKATTEAIKNKTRIDFSLLKEFYLEHIWNSIQFYDYIGRKVLSRSPKHILLLHENDLSALFLGDLIQLLKDRGWKIISPQEAYTDPIANEIPDILFNAQGRIGALGFARGLCPESLVQPSEDEKYLDRLLRERGVFK